jgi:hypothetical protein
MSVEVTAVVAAAPDRLYRSQASDVLSPSRHQLIQFGIATFFLHAALAESELILGIHKRGRSSLVCRVDTSRTQHTIVDDGTVLVRGHRWPNFLR